MTLACVSLLGACETHISKDDLVPIGVAEVHRLVEESDRQPGRVLLVDPRPQDRFQVERLPGARNLDISTVRPGLGRDPALDTFQTIVVYGDDPGSVAAQGMAQRMMAEGYRNVRFFAGGVREWRELNLPVESGGSTK